MVGTKPSIHLPPLLSATLARHDRRSATVSITFVSMLDFNGLPASAPLPCKITRAGLGWQRLRPKMKQIWDNGRSVGCKQNRKAQGFPMQLSTDKLLTAFVLLSTTAFTS